MSKKIVLIDYGMCNLLNVVRAFEHCGAEVHVTEDPKDLLHADKVVVPGVGSFSECIREIESRGFGEAVRLFSETDRPLLGICVGMQMFFESSEEFGLHAGLGILNGHVRAVPGITTEGEPQRVPHIGWSHLTRPETGREWGGTLLDDFQQHQPAVYFVHSFAAVPADDTMRLADTVYGGHRICAAIQKNNLMATQFHPERSGPIGLAIAKRFVNL
ncbi:MAG: imidazole glycerol phosphate synthase subunit HisH [Herminiimonas sp.]|uniref:imidazole glycerol phosphate synthase subunit HisH n=1 Tax=Herminiimonas sp. TaxID=1926289 RepID=UPI00271CC77E|nr:imidazole glycerol phosphate synthase subunit HisH [Herminiimonas sp.]MDO9419777.1 imidazole glycerol phosphate synthase subunit HisH [Herminiimonas sp.]